MTEMTPLTLAAVDDLALRLIRRGRVDDAVVVIQAAEGLRRRTPGTPERVPAGPAEPGQHWDELSLLRGMPDHEFELGREDIAKSFGVDGTTIDRWRDGPQANGAARPQPRETRRIHRQADGARRDRPN